MPYLSFERNIKEALNATTNYEETPLHLAAAKGHCDIVNFLAKKECDLNGKTKIKDRSYTAMHLATLQNHRNVVKCLLENGADFRIKDHEPLSVFILAVEHGRVEIANELINNGADVNETFNIDSKL